MKRLKIFITISFLTVFIVSANAQIHVIPRPQQITMKNGAYILSSKTVIVSDESTQKEATYLADILEDSFGQKATVKSEGKGIVLTLDVGLKNRIGNEGYQLEVYPQGVQISGATNAGIFYGIQTLRQLLPPDFEFHSDNQKTASLQCVSIEDHPRFQWRAFMLDESRHFQGMELVKELIDQMALMKMNIFHWHLTDDQGWRIEIKKYPKLTSVGGFRNNTQTVRHEDVFSGEPHGGFYTQEQMEPLHMR